MTPRSNVDFLPLDMPINEMVEELKRTRHTKVPIYAEHRDEIQGMLHARDLLAADLYALEKQPEGLIDILREPYFVPETKSASDLFRTFRKRMLSVALVVDDIWVVVGVVTGLGTRLGGGGLEANGGEGGGGAHPAVSPASP